MARQLTSDIPRALDSSLDAVGKYAYISLMAPKTLRTVSWIKAARKDFGDFPTKAQDKALDALTIVADGAMPDIAKPLTGLGCIGVGDQGAW